MAWAKDPLMYPSIFRTVLEAALEGRDRVTFNVPIGKEQKYRFQFYGYRTAWKLKAERSKKLQKWELAALDEANAAKLGMYITVVGAGRISFVHKDILVQEEGITVELGEVMFAMDDFDIQASSNAQTEQNLFAQSITRKYGNKAPGAKVDAPVIAPLPSKEIVLPAKFTEKLPERTQDPFTEEELKEIQRLKE